MGELTLELPMANQSVGVGVIAGYGVVSIAVGEDRESVAVYEAGATFRYYAIGDYSHGMQLGVEFGYVGASTSIGDTFATATGLWTGGFVGYKVATPSGFTFDGQVGAQYLAAVGEAEGESVGSSSVGALVNLNIGWTF